MGIITKFYISDKLGNRLNQCGNGTIIYKGDFSGALKIEERVVLNTEVTFDDGSVKLIVLKLAKIEDTSSLDKKFWEENDDLYTSSYAAPLTETEDCLKNTYLHESIVYKFFSDKKIIDPIIDKYVLKSYGSGISNNKTIAILNNENEYEPIDLSSHTDINNFIDTYITLPEYSKNFIYISTEFNNDNVQLSKGFKSKGKEVNFITSCISSLVHLYKNYKFCHWDFHMENTLYNKKTGDIQLFDFDRSTLHNKTPNVKNGTQINILPVIFLLTIQILNNHSQPIDEVIYYNTKTYLVHLSDMCYFLCNCYNDVNLEVNLQSLKTDSNVGVIVNNFYTIIETIKYIINNKSIIEEFFDDNETAIMRTYIETYGKLGLGLDYRWPHTHKWNAYIDEHIKTSITVKEHIAELLGLMSSSSGKLNKKTIEETDIIQYIEICYKCILVYEQYPQWDFDIYNYGGFLLLNKMQEDYPDETASLYSKSFEDIITESLSTSNEYSIDSMTVINQLMPKIKKKIQIFSDIYKKNIKNCDKADSDRGSYSLVRLQKIAIKLGVNIKDVRTGKNKTKKVLCKELKQLERKSGVRI